MEEITYAGSASGQ